MLSGPLQSRWRQRNNNENLRRKINWMKLICSAIVTAAMWKVPSKNTITKNMFHTTVSTLYCRPTQSHGTHPTHDDSRHVGRGGCYSLGHSGVMVWCCGALPRLSTSLWCMVVVRHALQILKPKWCCCSPGGISANWQLRETFMSSWMLFKLAAWLHLVGCYAVLW